MNSKSGLRMWMYDFVSDAAPEADFDRRIFVDGPDAWAHRAVGVFDGVSVGTLYGTGG